MKINTTNRFAPINFSGRVNTLFFNDSHGNTRYLGNLHSAIDEFKYTHKDEANFCLSGGDIFLYNSENNKSVMQFMNKFLDALAMGNHDLEGAKNINDLTDKYGLNFKMLSSNVKFTQNRPLQKKLQKSAILEKNGEKIGVIGVSPPDFRKLLFITADNNCIDVDNYETTLQSVKQETENLEEQGIDKIFLLAHTGKTGSENEQYYRDFARLGGIDVILGGHDHKEINTWETSERNEPVLIAATGRGANNPFGENLDTIGIAELDFDEKGVLKPKKCSTVFKKTNEFKNKDWSYILDSDKNNASQTVAELNFPIVGHNNMIGENKTASLIADSNLWYANTHSLTSKKADFAFVNSGTVRADFDNTNVTLENIQKASPFPQTLIKTQLTKRQIFNTLNHAAASCALEKVMPGVMQVSGLSYVICKDLKVKDVYLTDNKGNKLECLDDAPDDKKYTVVYDDFLMQGIAGFNDLKKDRDSDEIEYFNANRAEALREYLEKNKDIWNLSFERIIKK